MVEEVRKISMELLDMVDRIVRQNVTNGIALSLYQKFLYPFLERKIKSTPEDLIKQNLQITFDKLKPFFEKKQLHDMVEEGEKIRQSKNQRFVKIRIFLN